MPKDIIVSAHLIPPPQLGMDRAQTQNSWLVKKFENLIWTTKIFIEKNRHEKVSSWLHAKGCYFFSPSPSSTIRDGLGSNPKFIAGEAV